MLESAVADTDGEPAAEPAPVGSISSRPAGGWLLALVIGLYMVLGLMVSVATPAWEANDEPDHVRNVETIVEGHMYRIGTDGGLESHQPPLYYGLLAIYQRALGIPVQDTRPAYIPSGGPALGQWDHNRPRDGFAQRFVVLLRLPNLLAGIGVVLLTFATARRLSRNRWTPLVAASIVAFIPKFVFLSAVVNNDNLANLLGACIVYLAVRACQVSAATSQRSALLLAGSLGALVGLSLATKLTAVALVLPALFGAIVACRRAGVTWQGLAAFVVPAVLIPLPWVWFTHTEYHDLFAGSTSAAYFDAVIPGLMRKHVDLSVFFHDLPVGIWSSFWYSSGWNQFHWGNWAYLPFWLFFLPGLIAGAFTLGRVRARRPELATLGLAVLAALLVFAYIGVITTGTQARVTFVGLAAFGSLAAIGLERLPPLARFVLPTLGVIGTLIAFRSDVSWVYLIR